MSQTTQSFAFEHLNPLERLDLIGALWDSLDQVESDVPLPDWHREEFDRRLASADADPGAGIPWAEVKARLAQRP